MLQGDLSVHTLLVLLCLHGVKAVDLITCERLTASLTCAQGNIKVLSGNYGRTDRVTCSSGRPPYQITNDHCTQSTSLSVLTTQCEGKQSCSIDVSSTSFNDPCPGTYKYLNVSYVCILPQPTPPPPKTVIICQDRSRTINCEGLSRLNILSANYGRRDAVTCPCRAPNAMSPMCISTVTRNLQILCNGKQRCNLHASNSEFVDRCRRVCKYLEVSYSCD